MSKVRIVTDSDASIPAHIVEKYSIEVIPQVLRVGRERYEDLDDLSADRLFQLVRESESGGRRLLPKVEAPGTGPASWMSINDWGRMPRRS